MTSYKNWVVNALIGLTLVFVMIAGFYHSTAFGILGLSLLSGSSAYLVHKTWVVASDEDEIDGS